MRTRMQQDKELSEILHGQDLKLYFKVLWDKFKKRTSVNLSSEQVDELIVAIREAYKVTEVKEVAPVATVSPIKFEAPEREECNQCKGNGYIEYQQSRMDV